MAQESSLFIVVTSGMDQLESHLAALLVALSSKQNREYDNVTLSYGGGGTKICKKGELAKLTLSDSLKQMVADQIEGFSSSEIPDNLEQLARLASKRGVAFSCCDTFYRIEAEGNIASAIENPPEMEDFIVNKPPLTQVVKGFHQASIDGADTIFF